MYRSLSPSGPAPPWWSAPCTSPSAPFSVCSSSPGPWALGGGITVVQHAPARPDLPPATATKWGISFRPGLRRAGRCLLVHEERHVRPATSREQVLCHHPAGLWSFAFGVIGLAGIFDQVLKKPAPCPSPVGRVCRPPLLRLACHYFVVPAGSYWGGPVGRNELGWASPRCGPLPTNASYMNPEIDHPRRSRRRGTVSIPTEEVSYIYTART